MCMHLCVYVYTRTYGIMCRIKKDEGGFLHTLKERSLNQIVNRESQVAE